MIPIAIREKAGLMPNTDVDFEFDGQVVRIVPSKGGRSTSRGTRMSRVCGERATSR